MGKHIIKMKVAVCISGFIRTWDFTRKSFESFVCGNDSVDIFIHTYYQNYYECSAEMKDIKYNKEQILDKFSGLNLVDYVIEDRNEIEKEILSQALRFNFAGSFRSLINESSDQNSKKVPLGYRIYDQLRKIYLCNELRKKTNIKYDCVIKTRFDVLYYQKLELSQYIDGHVHTDIGATGGIPGEIVTIGTPYVIDICSDRFTILDKFLCPNTRDLEESIKDVQIIGCTCRNTIPMCDLCSHKSLGHIVAHNKLVFSQNKIFCRVMRNENTIWIPGKGLSLIHI